MGIPSRARWQPQGPANRCIIRTKAMGWLNCTPTSFAMGVDKTTLGAKHPSGCDVRRYTGDTDGGTTLWQCRTAVEDNYGVKVEVHAGSTVVTPYWAAVQCQAGRGFVLQGNTAALLSTSHRSTGGGVNHAVWVNDVRGGSTGYPSQALVFDPAADGRYAGWGRAAQGPQWWSWTDVKRFAATLHPWGDDDSRLLGPGKFYAGFFADTEPHFHDPSHFGGKATSPFPDKLYGRKGSTDAQRYVRPGPGRQHPHIRTLAVGAPFDAYQVAKADYWLGSDVWYGDHNGHYWIHSTGITGAGVKP